MNRFGDKYRHEQKYLVDERDIALITARIRPVMKPDAFHPEGAYRIRSAYFDDYQDSALKQNLDGISPRSKFRIRIYNESMEGIHLEQKIKSHDLTLKKSCSLTREECLLLFQGRPGRLTAADRPLLSLLRTEMLLHGLFPAIIVEYERTAYTCREGNVRVTFDRNLASSDCLRHFSDAFLPKRPVMAAGRHIMEVKYDEFLPSYIKDALNTGKLERTTFSKYALCRIYGPGPNRSAGSGALLYKYNNHNRERRLIQ